MTDEEKDEMIDALREGLAIRSAKIQELETVRKVIISFDGLTAIQVLDSHTIDCKALNIPATPYDEAELMVTIGGLAVYRTGDSFLRCSTMLALIVDWLVSDVPVMRIDEVVDQCTVPYAPKDEGEGRPHKHGKESRHE